jgi:DNA (cytosine-5)-methyltransferase 1
VNKISVATQPTAIELFAGVGGFRLGLESAGWKTVWSNQWEPSTKEQHASSCYEKRFGDNGHSNEDISLAIDSHEAGQAQIPFANLIVGGFPCQDYSVAKSSNSALGLEGKKGVLWWQIHRLVSIIKPKIVFLENVDRLLKSPSSQRGRDFAVMLRTLGDLGYVVEWRVVNAAEYGFPQRRIRVLLVATREDVIPNSNPVGPQYFMEGLLPVVFPCEEYSEMKTFELSDDASVISANFNVGGKSSPFSTAGIYHRGSGLTANGSAAKIKSAHLGSVLEDDAKVPESFWIDEGKLKDWDYLKGAKSVARVSKSGHSYNYSEGKMAFPDSLDRPSRTILTGEGGSAPSRFKHIIKTDKGFRRLLPVELERLNGFPDDWTKFDMNGKEISDNKRAFFMGNALVVGLIEKVGKELIRRHFS